jgi:hypothetical protein
MQLMNQPTSQPITAFVLDRILAFLAPLFLDAAEGNLQAARCAAAETLQAYAARSEQELSLAAQVIAFSLRSLDALARAAAADLDIRTILRLNASAATLHRAAMRAQKELDRLRAQPVPSQPQPQSRTAAEPPALLAFADAIRRSEAPSADTAPASPALTGPAPTDPAAADPAAPGTPRPAAAPAPMLSRQQRRLAKRLAERERRHPDLVHQIERSLLEQIAAHRNIPEHEAAAQSSR